MVKEKQKCEETVFSYWSHHQCSRNANIEIEGKHYCGIHNPIKIKEKDDKKRKKWEKEWAERSKRNDYQNAAVKYCEKKGLTIEQLNDALTEDSEGGKK